MQTRYLIGIDLIQYRSDILQCVKDNPQICDYESFLNINDDEAILSEISSYIQSYDSCIEGIFDDDYDFLYGFVIYDKIRLTDDGNSAEIHICSCKHIWGKDFYKIYKNILKYSMFDVLYANMPACCRGAITLCKKLGFKKTGYVPKTIPYTTTKGEVKMFDELIYTYVNKRCLPDKQEVPF